MVEESKVRQRSNAKWDTLIDAVCVVNCMVQLSITEPLRLKHDADMRMQEAIEFDAQNLTENVARTSCIFHVNASTLRTQRQCQRATP